MLWGGELRAPAELCRPGPGQGSMVGAVWCRGSSCLTCVLRVTHSGGRGLTFPGESALTEEASVTRDLWKHWGKFLSFPGPVLSVQLLSPLVASFWWLLTLWSLSLPFFAPSSFPCLSYSCSGSLCCFLSTWVGGAGWGGFERKREV